MTLPRLYALSKYWEENPPVHVLLAAFMGLKKKKSEGANVEDFLADLSAHGVR